MKPIRTIFPRASEAFFAANPDMTAPLSRPDPKDEVQGNVAQYKGILKGKIEGNRPTMNKTETEFSLILEADRVDGEIRRWEYEGITLRWADMKYTPDFLVTIGTDFYIAGRQIVRFKLIEVKGGHIWDRDIVRFKGARAYWPEFTFEMWQKKKGLWTQLH